MSDVFLNEQPKITEESTPDNSVVYVYKEYSDWSAYGEEYIKVFRSYIDAKNHLSDRFCSQTEADSIEAYKECNEMEEDTIEEDYISITTGNGCMFWVIEEHTIVEKQEED